MKTKHTPGAWCVYNNMVSGHTVYTEKDKGYQVIATCTNDHSIIPDNEVAANARLIAAAPELLITCDAVLTAWHSKLSNMHKKEPAYLQQIRDAIQKATDY